MLVSDELPYPREYAHNNYTQPAYRVDSPIATPVWLAGACLSSAFDNEKHLLSVARGCGYPMRLVKAGGKNVS